MTVTSRTEKLTSYHAPVLHTCAVFDDDLPELAASKVDQLWVYEAVVGEANPGDVVRYEIVLENLGTGIATGVVLEDLISLHNRLVEGSATASAGTVESEDPI